MLVSIVIPNFNYAEFLACAIDSALGVDWPTVEVIVVDDGSTDDSRAIIARYGDRITAIYQANAGQRAACNVGFARSRGEMVFFLDSDDAIDASIVREVAAVWRAGVSKVQVQMRAIDARGRATGSVLPQYRVVPTAGDIRKWVLSAAAYPTPPGSGNAYARTFLEAIFPLQGSEPAYDSYCIAAAPLLGDVLTIAKPLASYRVHGRNDGAMASLDVDRFGREITRAVWRFEYEKKIARSIGLDLDDASFDKSLFVLQYRIASLALAPERHPIRRDSSLGLLLRFVRAGLVPQGVSSSAFLSLLFWALGVTLTPSSAKKRLVSWRFASVARPRAVRRTLKFLRAVAQ